MVISVFVPLQRSVDPFLHFFDLIFDLFQALCLTLTNLCIQEELQTIIQVKEIALYMVIGFTLVLALLDLLDRVQHNVVSVTRNHIFFANLDIHSFIPSNMFPTVSLRFVEPFPVPPNGVGRAED
jgi:hypothetical protein